MSFTTYGLTLEQRADLEKVLQGRGLAMNKRKRVKWGLAGYTYLTVDDVVRAAKTLYNGKPIEPDSGMARAIIAYVEKQFGYKSIEEIAKS